ncbi:MAG: zinc-dependent metalloprotease family protein [Bacteroidota bacterium]
MKQFLLLIAFAWANFSNAQTAKSVWVPVTEKNVDKSGERVIVPQKYKTYHLSTDEFKITLFNAPHEDNVSLKNSSAIVELPMPDGSIKKFRIVESPIMASELSVQFPDIKTFNIMGVDMPGTFGKLDWTVFGFHGMILSATGNIFIDPYCRNNKADYISYYTSDFVKDPSKKISEGVLENGIIDPPPANPNQLIIAGANLRKYRLALACTGEYAQAATGVNSPTTSQILSAVTTTVNRVDGVYETEVAVKLILVANETTVLFGNPNSDPFSGNSNGNVLISESQSVIDNNIGSSNYDIGHTFSTDGGGLAQLGVVCKYGQKARGITGSPQPVGDPYDIDYVSHEIGHEFGAYHTFSSGGGSCSGNNEPGVMVEPGSGVTIMAYAGICSPNDLAPNSIPYFHTISFDDIMTYSNTGFGNGCATTIPTGNHAPVVTAPATFTIPKSTYFSLTGSATDADSDPLTYSWEEIDNNSTLQSIPTTTAPFFRSYPPIPVPTRMFPKLSVILAGATSTLGEYLPSSAQTLNFRLTARDNRMGGGGVNYAGTQVVIASSGPFIVTYPTATGITWASNSTQTVTWNVASSNTAPVNCANVNILLSTDGGNTFTTVLSNTPNDGTESIIVPSQVSIKTTCRIKVEGAGNIFFDVSNNNFTISASTGPISPIADFTANNVLPCIGATVTFTDQSAGLPTAWAWTFSPSSVTFVGGTSASSQNPQVQFNAAGPYSVTLVATNTQPTNASNTMAKTNYIAPLNAVALPFNENFETSTFPPAGWVIENADAGNVAWGNQGAKGFEWRPAAGNSGSANGCAGIDCYDYDDSSQIDNLISKPISLFGAINPQLTFKRAYKYYNSSTDPDNYHDELKIFVSSDCGTTFDPALYFKKGVILATSGSSNNIFTPSLASDWDIDTINLNAYVGGSIIIKFEVGNRYGNNLYIDDINIASSLSTAVGNTESLMNDMTIYPNPTSENFTVSFNTSTKSTYTIEVRNVLGQILFKDAVNDFSGTYLKQFNVAEYGKGIYLVVFKNIKGETVKKVMVY